MGKPKWDPLGRGFRHKWLKKVRLTTLHRMKEVSQQSKAVSQLPKTFPHLFPWGSALLKPHPIGSLSGIKEDVVLCIQQHNWTRLATLLLFILDNPIHMAPAIWKIGFILHLNHPRSNVAALDEFVRDLYPCKKLWPKEMLLDAVVHWMTSGQTDRALELLRRREDRDRTQITIKKQRIWMLLSVLDQCIRFCRWKRTRRVSEDVEDIEMHRIHSSLEKAMLDWYSADECLGDFPYWMQLVEMLMATHNPEESLNILSGYINESCPESLTAWTIYLEFLKQNFPDRMDLIQSCLRQLIHLDPSSTFVLQRAENPDSGVDDGDDKSTGHVRELMEFMDFPSNSASRDGWSQLASGLRREALDRHLNSIRKDLWVPDRCRWWPNTQFVIIPGQDVGVMVDKAICSYLLQGTGKKRPAYVKTVMKELQRLTINEEPAGESAGQKWLDKLKRFLVEFKPHVITVGQ